MNILITGGAGFIGSHLVEYHLHVNHQVHVIDDLSTGTEDNIKPFRQNHLFRFTQEDIIVSPTLERAVAWADCIYHMAAVVGVFRVINEPINVITVDIYGTQRLLRSVLLSGRKPRILIASTSEVYGCGNGVASSEDSTLYVNPSRRSCMAYAISKMASEAFGFAYFTQYGIPVTSLRIFNTIGPRQIGCYGMVVPRFVSSAVENEPIIVFGSGEQTRSFIDVRDTVTLFDKVANCPQTIGKTINIGQNQEMSINQLALLVKRLSDSRSTITHVPYETAYGPGFDDFMVRVPDLTLLQQLVPYEYQWTIQKTVRDLIEKQRTTRIISS